MAAFQIRRVIADGLCFVSWRLDLLRPSKVWGKYYLVIERAGLDYGTLRNAAYTARRIDLSDRSDKLGYKHHEIAASLPALPQASEAHHGHGKSRSSQSWQSGGLLRSDTFGYRRGRSACLSLASVLVAAACLPSVCSCPSSSLSSVLSSRASSAGVIFSMISMA
jgi:hypothetical protein